MKDLKNEERYKKTSRMKDAEDMFVKIYIGR